MKIELNLKGKDYLEELYNIKINNILIDELIINFINNFDNAEFNKSHLSYEEYFYQYYDFIKEEKEIAKSYIKNNFNLCDINIFLNNPFLKNIKLNEININNYSIRNLTYKKGELFFINDINLNKNYKEFFIISYFNKDYTFPALIYNNNIWMSITPHEISTMEEAIKQFEGNILIFGLGLGYIAYMASIKNKVNKIIIVEKDINIIDIFYKNIFPCFNNKNKINIINDDVYNFLNHSNLNNINYVYVDIYHDNNDGLECYLKLKSIEKYFKSSIFLYWIEETLICNIRRILLDLIYQETYSINETQNYENKIFDELYNKLVLYLNNYHIKNINDLNQILSKDKIRNIISNLSWL